MNKPVSILILTLFGSFANAESSLPKEHINAMACLENMEVSTTWNQCLGLIFSSCSENNVGSEAHLSCLQVQLDEWNESLQVLQTDVIEAITLKSAEDLSKILSGWINYVSQKRQATESSMSKSELKAKQLGCQITENIGLAGEYAACLEGRSTAEYCVFKE